MSEGSDSIANDSGVDVFRALDDTTREREKRQRTQPRATGHPHNISTGAEAAQKKSKTDGNSNRDISNEDACTGGASAHGDIGRVPLQVCSTVTAANTTEADLPPFETNGIKFELFDVIVDAWGGVERLRGLTTTQVNDQLQKPWTAAAQSSAVSMLVQQQRHADLVGPANVFVSHAWKYLFLDVLDALRQYFEQRRAAEAQRGDVFIWFDLFCNNQHSATELPFEWWTRTFSSNIRLIGNTVMILAPWQAPVTLKRAWCLYEIFCTVETQSRFDVAMCHGEIKDFIGALTHHESFQKVKELIASIDVEQSEAFKPIDRDNIFAAVRAGPGFGSINLMILRKIREWVIETAARALKQADDAGDDCGGDASSSSKSSVHEVRRRDKLKVALGKLLIDQGWYDRCITLLEQAVSAVSGDDDEVILDMRHYLGEAYWKGGRYPDASVLMNRVLVERQALLGRHAPETLRSMHNCAMLLLSQCDYPAAQRTFEECIAARGVACGIKHLDTAHSCLGLAHVFTRVQKNDEAMALYERVLSVYTSQLGAMHADVLAVQNNVAYLLRQMGKYSEAAALLEENVLARKIKIGEEHPDTLRSTSNLAHAHISLGEFAQAVTLTRAVRAVQLRTIGERHPYSIYNTLFLARALHGGGGEAQRAEARALFEMILPIGKEVLGDNNYQVLEYEAFFKRPD